jgi:hypothetical protein
MGLQRLKRPVWRLHWKATTFAMHISTTNNQVCEACIICDYAFAHPSFQQACNLNQCLITEYNSSTFGPVEKAKLTQAVTRQWYLQSKIWTITIPGVISLDISNSIGMTLRQAVMKFCHLELQNVQIPSCLPTRLRTHGALRLRFLSQKDIKNMIHLWQTTWWLIYSMNASDPA